MAISRNSKGSPTFGFADGVTASYGDVYRLQKEAEKATQKAAGNLNRAGDEMISFKNDNAPRA